MLNTQDLTFIASVFVPVATAALVLTAVTPKVSACTTCGNIRSVHCYECRRAFCEFCEYPAPAHRD